MTNKNILILGAGGSLGSNLCRLLTDYGQKVVAVDVSENNLAYLYRIYNLPMYIEDIRDFDKIRGIIKYEDIDVVINCAALKHVNWCDTNIRKAIDINILSNLELVNYCSKNDKKFIYISSDKAINPKNIYALTKQFTDYMVNLYKCKLVRGVNFINSKGSVIDIWEREYKDNRPFTVVNNDMCRRYFITISEMSQIVNMVIHDNTDQIEYTPKKIYDISIVGLFEAYIKMNGIKDFKVDKITLEDNEKLVEDIDFEAEIIEVNEIDDIIGLLKK